MIHELELKFTVRKKTIVDKLLGIFQKTESKKQHL